VKRYVDDLPHAEIAAALGVSEDAVAMRITRGKVVLRRTLAADLGIDPDWEPTRVWCRMCGRRTLLVQRGDRIVFRCPGCSDDPAVVVDPTLVGPLRRPSAILRRTSVWARRYYAGGVGAPVACAACGARVAVRAYDRGGDPLNRRGLYTSCESCGIELSSSLASLALAGEPSLARPSVVAEEESGGTIVIELADVLTRRRVSVAYDGETLLAR
jgi:Zn finger protein HypA/HybF involved in hydrogenase expression